MSRETLRLALAAATDGPWHAGGDGAVCSDEVEDGVCWPVASATSGANARFIAGMSVHLPALLALADAAEAVVWVAGVENAPVPEAVMAKLRAALAALEALP